MVWAHMTLTNLKIERIDTRQDDVRRALTALRERLSPRGNIVSEAGRRRTIEVFGEPLTPQQVVERICTDVREKGLAAVLEYTSRIDKAQLTRETIRVPAEDLAAAHAQAAPEFLSAIHRIRENILRFQCALLPADVRVEGTAGSYLRQRYLPLRRVGICVPGGAAAYPSTVLMTVVPAQAAGVRELVVIAPPTPLGAYNADLLATCHELGVSEVYRMGGAQGVAALAYGVEGLPRVDKIVGPGNLFVALAKKFVFGEVDIDAIAGPSEVVVIADDTARADFTAADLIAQAEHAPGASILISWSDRLLEETSHELTRQLAQLERGDLARQSLEQFGALIRVRSADEAAALANEIAPEHLHIATADPERLLEKIPHTGAAFLGHYSPVALGDYAAGPSHVLPTGGTARFASGLSALDFVRGNSVIAYTQAGLAAAADDIRLLAEKEGLTAHRASVELRLKEETSDERR
ncbi:MAG TPA: histidinol dehydrogenase [Pirellulales bacterium]|jgi:histidinol dehydrogenase|nr:histidinol dehydrogenase [Pirellulales bacterium]